MMPVGDVTPEIAMVLGAAMALLIGVFLPRRKQWLGAILALATLAVSAALVVVVATGTNQKLTFFGTWALDDTAASAKLLILATTALVVVLSPEWFRDDSRHAEYYPLLLFSALGAMVIAAAADTMELLLGVLLSSITGYTLAAYHRRSALSVEAGMKYFLVGALANALLAMGIVLLFGAAGTTLLQGVASPTGNPGSTVWIAATVLVATGLVFKMGAAPAHAWMPDVAQGAPAPAAAFLTVVPKIGAAVAIARLLSVLPADDVGWRALAAIVATATMTLGNLAALWQDDLRRLLGWSAVSQSGYALMAVVAVDASHLAIPALLYFLLAYALANLCAFAVVTELRGRTRLDDYRGLAAVHPWLAACLALSLLSLVGIPPLAGFAGKLTLFAATIDAGYAWLAAVAVANTVISLFYYLRVIGPVYFDETRPQVAFSVLGGWAATATVLAGASVVVIGVIAEPLLNAFSSARLLP